MRAASAFGPSASSAPTASTASRARALGLGRQPGASASPSRETSRYAKLGERLPRPRSCSSSASSRAATAGSSPRATTPTSASAAGSGRDPACASTCARLCEAHGVSPDDLESVRGYRLPLRSPALDARARPRGCRRRRRRADRPGLRRRHVRGLPLAPGSRPRPSLDLLAGPGRGASIPTATALARRPRTHLLGVLGREGGARPLPADHRSRSRSRASSGATSSARPRRDRRTSAAARGLARPPPEGARAPSLGRRATPEPGVPRKPDEPVSPYDARVQNYLLTTLDGGTRVVTEPLPSVRSVAIGLWIGAGSRDEDDAHAGVSHFLEHLLFKGTALVLGARDRRDLRHASAAS